MILTRRGLIWLAPWSLLYGFGDKDFWNSKDPDNWSSEEVSKLLRKSPWAKEIAGQRTTTTRNGPIGTGPMGMPTVRANCTRAQFALGMGGDPPSVPSPSRPALPGLESAPNRRY
jgi:hypothetical protein